MIFSLSSLSTRTIDDAIRVSDQRFRDRFFIGLLVCTTVVLVGVILEEAEILPLPIRRQWIDAETGLTVTNHCLNKWLKRIARIGWLLIIIGVLGEGLFEELASRADAILQNFDEILLTSSQREAADAQLSAEYADEASRDAQSSADNANAAAGGATKKAEAIGKQANVIDWSLAMTQYLMTSRAVQDPPAVKDQLEKFKGKSVIFRSYKNDGDGYFLCGELAAVAKDAGMFPTNQCGEWPFIESFPSTGIYVSGPDDDSMLALEQVMLHVTPAFGASAGPFGKGAKHPPTFIIFIGKKSDFRIGQVRPTPNSTPNKATKSTEKSP